MALGLYIIVYTKQVGDVTGEFEFVERFMGPGRTYSFLKFLGLLMIIIPFMWMFGGLEDLIVKYLGWTVGLNK